MTKRFRSYAFTRIADKDLDSIYKYTRKNFGAQQAATYLRGLNTCCERLLDNPELGRDRSDIKKGLRSLNCQQHMLYYRLMGEQIRIVRVRHFKKDYINLL